MRIGLVYPPALELPRPPSQALALCAGALRSQGHEPRLTDLNLLAADYCLNRAHAEELIRGGLERAEAIEREGDSYGSEVLSRMLRAFAPTALAGEEHKLKLRDPAAFREQSTFKAAFWAAHETLDASYRFDQVLSPQDPNFARDMVANQEADVWTIHQAFYAFGLVEEVLKSEPTLVVLHLGHEEQSVESVRFARQLRATSPAVKICFRGPLIRQFADRWVEDNWIFDYIDFLDLEEDESGVVGLAELLEGSNEDTRVTQVLGAKGALSLPLCSGEAATMEPPVPDYSSVDLSLCFTPDPILPLLAKPATQEGETSSLAILRRDLVDLARGYGIRHVQVQDELLPPDTAREVARIVEDEALDVVWSARMELHPVFLDAEFCSALSRGGCRSITMRLNSGSAQNESILANLRGAGISVDLLWAIGQPGQTRQEAYATIHWMLDHRDLFGLSGFDEKKLKKLSDDAPETCVLPPREGSPEVEISPNEARILTAALVATNNRALIESGSHLIHLGVHQVAIAELARPFDLPPVARDFMGHPVSVNSASVQGKVKPGRFFDDDLGFRRLLEANWQAVREEWEAASRAQSGTVVWDDPANVTHGNFSLFPLFGAGGRPFKTNLARFPRTLALLRQVPHLYAAAFGVFAPNTLLPEHVDETPLVLRSQLALTAPQPAALCVEDEIRRWESGKTLVFDALLPHCAWNFGDSPRVILAVDVVRPEIARAWTSEHEATMKADLERLAQRFPESAQDILETAPFRSAVAEI